MTNEPISESPHPLQPRSLIAEQASTIAFAFCAFLAGGVVLCTIGIFGWQVAAHLTDLSHSASPVLPLTVKELGMLLAGTVLTTTVALSIALPIGLLGALYLTDFASPRARLLLKAALEVLAVVPPIVWAFFAVAGFSGIMSSHEPSALLAGITLGFMILPMTATLIEDAIFHVPKPLLEAAIGLGATRLQALARVVLPTAAPGIAAAVLLSLSRAVGETVIVGLAAGTEMRFTLDPREAVETVTGFILRIGIDTPDAAPQFESAFLAGAVLFIITGILHVFAGRLLRRRVQ